MYPAIPPTIPSRGWSAAARAPPVRSWMLARAGVDARNHRHAGTQQVDKAIGVVNDNFDSDTLHYFREISRGIVRRKKRELRTRTRRKREYMPVQPVAGKSIHGDVGAFSDAHVRQLGFLVVRNDPHIRQRCERGYLASPSHELPRLYLALPDDAVLRRQDTRVRKIELRDFQAGRLRCYRGFCLSLLGGENIEQAGCGTLLCAGLVDLRGELCAGGLQLLPSLGR